MNFIIKNIRWAMLASGVLTATMLYGLFAPQEAMESMFGVSFHGTLETLIIRSWSSLVGLIGIILIYGAFREKSRVFCISIAALSKAIFITLILVYGQGFLKSAAPAIIIDGLLILLALLYIMAIRIKPSAT